MKRKLTRITGVLAVLLTFGLVLGCNNGGGGGGDPDPGPDGTLTFTAVMVTGFTRDCSH